MTFNDTNFAIEAVLTGLFAELASKAIASGGRLSIPTRGDEGLFSMFNSRLPQATHGNQNAMGRKFHKMAPIVGERFGFIKQYKQNRVKPSKVEYVFIGLTAA